MALCSPRLRAEGAGGVGVGVAARARARLVGLRFVEPSRWLAASAVEGGGGLPVESRGAPSLIGLG